MNCTHLTDLEAEQDYCRFGADSLSVCPLCHLEVKEIVKGYQEEIAALKSRAKKNIIVVDPRRYRDMRNKIMRPSKKVLKIKPEKYMKVDELKMKVNVKTKKETLK